VWCSGSLGQEPFDDVLGVLHYQFLEPREGVVRPTLGVNREHDPGREAPVLCGADDVVGGVEDEAQADPIGLLGQLVAHARLPAVPTAAGVGEIEHLIKVNIQVWLAHNAQLPVIMGLPEIQVIDSRRGASVHADGAHRRKLPQLCQVGLKIRPGTAFIALAGRQVSGNRFWESKIFRHRMSF